MNKGALFLIIVTAMFMGCTKQPLEEYCIVTFVVGDVTKNNIAIQIGDAITEKDTIQTAADSFCDIKIGESLLRVKQKTTVVFSTLLKNSEMENTAMDLNAGKMLCKPKKLLKSDTFMVKTPTAVAGVRGTQFTVETDTNGTSRIKVFEGQVRVAKRIQSLESDLDKIMKVAPELQKEEKVVITKKDVEITEKAVDELLKKESSKGWDAAHEAALNKAGKSIFIDIKEIGKFAVEDYTKDNKEIIDIKRTSPDIINEINRAIEKEKGSSKANGRLLITRYEVYFIKNGKIEWEGAVGEEPIRKEDRLYVASGEYVFCVSIDGPVYWRKKIENDGKIQLRGNRLIVLSNGQEIKLDVKTGEKKL